MAAAGSVYERPPATVRRILIKRVYNIGKLACVLRGFVTYSARGVTAHNGVMSKVSKQNNRKAVFENKLLQQR